MFIRACTLPPRLFHFENCPVKTTTTTTRDFPWLFCHISCDVQHLFPVFISLPSFIDPLSGSCFWSLTDWISASLNFFRFFYWKIRFLLFFLLVSILGLLNPFSLESFFYVRQSIWVNKSEREKFGCTVILIRSVGGLMWCTQRGWGQYQWQVINDAIRSSGR